MKRLIVLTIIIFLFTSGSTFGQEKQRRFTVFASVPLIYDDDFGFEKTNPGLGIVIDYDKPFSSRGISWITTVDFSAVGYKNKSFAAVRYPEDPLLYPKYTKSFYNLSLMTGFKNQFKITSFLNGYGLIQTGFRIAKPPDYSEEHNSEPIREWSFDPFGSVGIGVGGGLVFNEKYNTGVRFYVFQDNHSSAKNKGGNYTRHFYTHSLLILLTFGFQL
ncbi:hypothetical protein ACFL7D_07645 [candidate division KSB1 bacterium]